MFKNNNEDEEIIDLDFQNEMQEMGFNFSKKNGENMIELVDDVDADIIVSSTSSNKKSLIFKFLLLIIPLTIIIFSTILFTNNKIVFNNVVGSNTRLFNNLSIISNQYQVTPNDIKIGNKIMYTDGEKANFGPFIVNYKIARVAKMNDLILYVDQDGSKDLKKINMFNVLYIIDNTKND